MLKKLDDAGTALPNPLLDYWIAGADSQLKAWQAYHVEGAHFVGKRLHANLEFLRLLGHCGEPQDTVRCHRTWLNELYADYTKEFGRIAGTTAALMLSTLGPAAWTGQGRSATVAEPDPQNSR